MLDLFRQLKLEYQEYLILFKSGSFYVSFDEDAMILNNIFDYKIIELKNNIKVGFPLSLIDKNISIIESKKINYIMIENKNIVKKEKYKFNNFKKYSTSIFEMIQVNSRIQTITNKLKKLSGSCDRFNEILDQIEVMIDGEF